MRVSRIATASTMSERTSSRWSRLVFNGDEKNYELWETKFYRLVCISSSQALFNRPSGLNPGNEIKEHAAVHLSDNVILDVSYGGPDRKTQRRIGKTQRQIEKQRQIGKHNGK